MSDFTVLLGLVDFINPILYTCFFILLFIFLYNRIQKLHWVFVIIGGCITIFIGFLIPIYKVICGLGLLTFNMPVYAIFGTLVGFLTTGLALLIASYRVFKRKTLLLFLSYVVAAILISVLLTLVQVNVNSVAVIFATIGLYLIYISVLGYAIRSKIVISIVLFCISMVITALLSLIGVFGDMSVASNHWITQISNICCQTSLLIGFCILYRKCNAKKN